MGRSFLLQNGFGFTIKTALNLKTLTPTVHGVIFGRAFKMSEGYLHLTIFLWGGEGEGLFLRGLIFGNGGGGGAYYILRYSLVRTCVKSCQFFL